MAHSSLGRALALLAPFTLIACAAGAVDDGTGGAGRGASTGGSVNSGGSASGGTSSVGTGGATTGGSATGGSSAGGVSAGGAPSGGASNTGGTGNTGPVTADLPYSEDWESGTFGDRWLPTDPSLVGEFSFVDTDHGKSLQLQSSGDEILMAGGNRTWTDIHLSLNFQIVSGDPQAAIAVRLDGVKTFYYIEIGDGHFKIRDRNNGASDLQPADKPALNPGQWYKLDFVIQGSTATASLDGQEIVSGTMNSSPPLASGGIGLGSRGGSDGVVLFDDISVTAP